MLARLGRLDEAVELYERLLSLSNDLGLLSEEYDPERKRLVGNFPQAFTHLALVETAYTLRRRLGEPSSYSIVSSTGAWSERTTPERSRRALGQTSASETGAPRTSTWSIPATGSE